MIAKSAVEPRGVLWLRQYRRLPSRDSRMVSRNVGGVARIVRKRSVATVFALGLGLVLFLSGLRYEPERYVRNSAPICGPLTDQFGDSAGDAGPCPSATMPLDPNNGHWEWAPIWLPRE